MDEKRDYDEYLDKKDSLMWSEEDYSTMEKLTGFDTESIEQEQKKTIQIVILVIVCLLMLVVGFIIGYNFPKSAKDEQVGIAETPKIFEIEMAYTKKNNSGELYLYIVDNNNEEQPIFELSPYYFYSFNCYQNDLYVILVDDKISLFKVELTKFGHTNQKIKEFDIAFDDVFFANNLIYFVKDGNLKVYDVTTAELIDQNLQLSFSKIFSINEKSILYLKEEKLYIYDLEQNQETLIGADILEAMFIDDKILYFKFNDNHETIVLYEFNLDDSTNKFISDMALNSAMLLNIKGGYLYVDGDKLYLYDGINSNEIYQAKEPIIEISYLNHNEVIIISNDYEITNCFNNNYEVGIFNIASRNLKIKEVTGCLDTTVINDVVFAD
ncbi:MAG: hypothetical protein IJB71_01055 [Bacilli bacterium]|nr:hypothetical protein [Bacilli bacterium]